MSAPTDKSAKLVCARLRAVSFFFAARPPFGAHACGTRHRLLPRWLSSRTGFPAAAADGCFTRFANQRKKIAAVKHAPCGPVFVPVDRGPEAARERIGKNIRARAPHPAFAVSACRPERRPAQSEVIYLITETVTICQGKSDSV